MGNSIDSSFCNLCWIELVINCKSVVTKLSIWNKTIASSLKKNIIAKTNNRSNDHY